MEAGDEKITEILSLFISKTEHPVYFP